MIDPNYVPGVTPVEYPEPGTEPTTGTGRAGWTQDAIPGTGGLAELAARLRPGLTILRTAGLIPEEVLTAENSMELVRLWHDRAVPGAVTAADLADLSVIVHAPRVPEAPGTVPVPEALALEAVVDEDYDAARELIAAMSRKDRAVFAFYITELVHILQAVDATDTP